MPALTPQEVRDLQDVLDDEQRAWTTWSQVLRDLGDVSAFSTIAAAHARHLDALARLFARHGLPVSPNPWEGRVPRFTSRADACGTGAPGRGVDGTLPEWSDVGDDARFMVLDTGESLRLDHGAPSLDALEQKVWADPTFADEKERCAAQTLLFKSFGGPAGTWTPERAARHAARCPGAK